MRLHTLASSILITVTVFIVSGLWFGLPPQRRLTSSAEAKSQPAVPENAFVPPVAALSAPANQAKSAARRVLSPETLQKLARERTEASDKERYDQPQEAADFYRLKRVPAGAEEIPLERYFAAREQLRKMPRFASARQQSTNFYLSQYGCG